MPVLLQRTPISELPAEVVVRGQRVRIRRHQIVVWVTLTTPPLRGADPRVSPFPAILDTGYTHTFAIQERHLIEWAGLNPEALPVVGAAREQGRRIPLQSADVWVHANESGSRERLTGGAPFGVSAPEGIAVYPSALNFPRLPLLGLRAIAHNNLVLVVNGHRREATLRTARRWWPVAGR